MKKLFTLIALLGMCVSGAWADTKNVTLYPTADAYVDWVEANKSTNYGTSDVLRCGAWQDQFGSLSPGLKTNSSSNAKDQIAILKFDVSDYKGKITAATLKLTGQGEETGYGANFMLFSCNNTDWVENEVQISLSGYRPFRCYGTAD